MLVALAMALASGARSGSTADFTDPLGDSHGAPDIVAVSVSNDAKGELSVTVLFFGGGVIAPGQDVQTTLVLDTDKNKETGSDGFDYAIQYDARDNTHAVGRWDGMQFAIIDTPARVNWSSLSVQFAINRSYIGGTTAFDFFVRSHRSGPGSGLFDDAPGDGVWSYEFSTPTIAKLTSPSTISPRAGRVLDVRRARVQLSDNSIVAPERLACRLVAGRAVLKPLRGGCRWLIPQRLKGRTVVLTLVARFGTSELRVTRRAKVR